LNNKICVSIKKIIHIEFISHYFISLNKISQNCTLQSADVSVTKQRGDTELSAPQRQQMQDI
jgi:hypothetical protein